MMAPLKASEGSRAVKRTIEFIRHHRLQKGDRLPSERELSDRFGVTRGSVREALAVLDALRLTDGTPAEVRHFPAQRARIQWARFLGRPSQ
jgi:GntR family transcriptional repressor for pyruvate dehydrogenase complex